jgi:hypothetical protein
LNRYLIPISLLTLLGILSIALYHRNVTNLSFDLGDAPSSYGLVKHKDPETGPYFGQKRGDNDKFTDITFFDEGFGNIDDAIAGNDEDAFNNNFTNLPDSATTTTFLSDIDLIEDFYVLDIPVSGAEEGDPVRGWIDFNGNGRFDNFEKASAEYEPHKQKVSLAWKLSDSLQPAVTFARIRTCKKIHRQNIEDPDTEVTTGEAEDYLVRIIKPQQTSTEQRKYMNLAAYCGLDSITISSAVLKGMKIGDITASVNFRGSIPNIFGINNMHEASQCGIRLGHDSMEVTADNPIITSVIFARPLEKLSFKLIDIDGGDRVRIRGYYKGKEVRFNISNLSDNFYYQFNTVTGEIYSGGNSDAGNDAYIPSSLDMGVEVSFIQPVDKIQLSYSDDVSGSSGTYTLAAISARSADYPEVIIDQVSADEKNKMAVIKWKASNNNYVSAYIIEKSTDGISFEQAGTVQPGTQTDSLFSFGDSSLPSNIRSCYYRIKTIEVDNNTNYTKPFRLRRDFAESLTGFYFINQSFTNRLDLVFTTDIPANGSFKLFDYRGKLVRTAPLINIHKGDTITISGLDHLPENSYYGELITTTGKYVIEAFKYTDEDY